MQYSSVCAATSVGDPPNPPYKGGASEVSFPPFIRGGKKRCSETALKEGFPP